MGILSTLWKSTTFSTERLISVIIWDKMASFLVLIASELHHGISDCGSHEYVKEDSGGNPAATYTQR